MQDTSALLLDHCVKQDLALWNSVHTMVVLENAIESHTSAQRKIQKDTTLNPLVNRILKLVGLAS